MGTNTILHFMPVKAMFEYNLRELIIADREETH